MEGGRGTQRIEEKAMSDNAVIEQRLARLEAAVADLQRQIEARLLAENWLDKIIGICRHNPDFDKMVQYGREIRQADRPSEDNEP